MAVVKATDNPLVITEGRFINNMIKNSTKDLKIYDPKNKRMITGQDARQLIDDINNGRFVNADVRILDPQDESKKQDNSEMYKKAKTVKFKKVK